MKRWLKTCLRLFLALVALGASAFYWFIHAPAPERPALSGTLERGAFDSGGHRRAWQAYVPRGLRPGAPLVIVMHGSGEDGSRIRIESGYGFERLADRDGFVVAYPDAFEGYWNGCNVVGDYSANRLGIDDVGFLVDLADRLHARFGTDPQRVFAAGASRGGHMAYRLALEAPTRFLAVAAISANVPMPGNFKCHPSGRPAAVMILNGTKDPINPFDGGEVKLFGLLRRGTVLSSEASARWFAAREGIAGAPRTERIASEQGFDVERTRWTGGSGRDVELVAVHGGGHVIPQPWYRSPRLLGPTPTQPDGTALIWDFFERQAAARPAPGTRR